MEGPPGLYCPARWRGVSVSVEQRRTMDNAIETWKTIPKRPVAQSGKGPLLVHLYPPGPGLGVCYPLNGAPLVIGRGDDCDIRIPDCSVSRRHACIRREGEEHVAVDLNSTNGTYINDAPVFQG